MDLKELLAAVAMNYYNGNGTAVSCADEALTDLTPTDLLSIIADCVSRLPHAGEGPGPSLELGHSAEAADLILDIAEKQSSDLRFERKETGYACVRIGGLWVGACKPKGGAL